MTPAIERTGGSLIRALHARRRATTIDLGLGEPTLFPNVEHFKTATAWIGEHGCRYSTNIGDLDLREAIAAKYAYPGYGAGNVCVTAGSQEAVYVSFRALLDPAKDDVLVVEPCFPVYVKIAQVENLPLRRVTLDPLGTDPFDPEAILAAVGPDTRLIVICSPNNPTGRIISKASARRLAEGLLARGGEPVYVMHDEIYRELAYTDDVGEFAKIYPYTIAVNSLSKSNALTGLRLGWVFAPDSALAQIVKMHGWVTSCANTFSQRVAFEIFSADELGAHRPWYARQRAGVLAAAREAALDFIEPDGAFYLCVRAGGDDTLAFAETLIERSDVIAIPGYIFGANLAGWLRTSFVAPLDEVREGLHRIAALSATLVRV
ncbi:MAG: pyridoxal phosphate-dependent aminotransferase [Candidatus Eremiobacteraeota bacterium]|nr:pyridoxal phosphate-dependent aminotransferase [Candidatus Eremiobacteraeota bacterium]